MYGLAYDAASDDYKILKIDVTPVGPEVSNEILALKSGSWKRVGKPSFRVLPLSFGVQSGTDCLAFVHGTFHWVGLSNYGSTIVSFNISNEVYGQIPLLERMCIYCMMYREYEVSVWGDTPRSERRSALMAGKQIATAKLPNYPKLKVKFPSSGPAGIQLAESQHKLLKLEWIPSYRVANPDKLGTRCTGRLTVRPKPPEDTTTLYFDL
ncbi:hypothetical protein CQW23_27262 [Capsicum baccatum]|uniref:F-box associated domain-containing protein n=1 Tax=Capsicum baccatum TaxID=33114 RepID=A0A2G2VD59_CAPBA|nr:hypothetical protein CQW23_27262 [Capsicum baccatum]